MLAGRTFTSERQYRNALARRRGHASWHAAQRAARVVGTRRQYLALSAAERDAYDRALDALALKRRDGRLSLKAIATRADTTVNTVLRYAGRQFRRDARGHVVASRYDRMYRAMWMYTERGKEPVDVYDSRSAARLAQYHADVDRALTPPGSDAPLRKYRGKHITLGKVRYPFVTDLPTLKRLAQANELSAEGPYRHD